MSELQANTFLVERVAQDPAARLFAIPDSFGGWFDLSAAEFDDRVRALAKGFIASGLQHGDRVGVLCSNRFESTLVDFATALVGVAVVPIPADASQSAILTTLDTSGVVAMVVETARDFARFDELHGDLPRIADVWQIALNGLDKLVLAGRGVDDALLGQRAAGIGGDTALADYYVGGAGDLRLVTVTHGQLAQRAVALGEVLAAATGARGTTGDAHSTLLVLPATDPTARLITLVAVSTGMRFGHLSDPAALIRTLESFRPSLLVARPSTFEQIDDAALDRAQAAGRGPALRQALDVAVEYAEALDAGSQPRGLKTRFALADAIFLRGLRKAAGGRLIDVVSLAGPKALSHRLRYLMRALDVRPLEAYGTVETAGLAIIERPGDPFARPVGTVGLPLAGIEASMGSDGSLLLRGGGISADNDWFDTGLEADVDAAGRVTLLLPEAESLPIIEPSDVSGR